MSTAPLRQVDYLDELEQRLLANAHVCPIHGVIRENGRCCVCMAAPLEKHNTRRAKR